MIRKFFLLTFVITGLAQASQITTDKGTVRMRGELVNGGCTVSQESQHMLVDMGQYRTNAFSGVGSYSSTNVPFTVNLVACDSEVYRHVGIAFQGVTPAEDPQVFLATTWLEGSGRDSGVGLAIFDEQQHQITPNTVPQHYMPIITDKVAFHFSARYRAVSETLLPGKMQSDVWFTLVYP